MLSYHRAKPKQKTPKQKTKDGQEVSSALAAAYRCLMLRDHSALELEGKLQRRGFSNEVITEVVGTLKKHGYINDSTFARRWLRAHIEHQPWGPLRLARELRNRGISQDVVNLLLEELLPPEKLEARILAVGASYWRKHKGAGICRALARHLTQLGYETSDIARVLEKLSNPPSGLA